MLINKLIQRIRKGEETLFTLLIRIPFLLNPRWLFSEKAVLLWENWDILIVLDACRFDSFKKLNYLPGILTKKVSLGTHTVEWAKKNFQGKDGSDIIYISGNPQVSNYKIRNDWQTKLTFRKLIDAWQNHWDEHLGTILPRQLNKVALEEMAKEENKGKRYIIHYMQPHIPFVGKCKIEIDKNHQKSNVRWWRFMKKNEGGLDRVIKAYESNLVYVLEELQPFINELPHNKKLVITSDHGEAFGEFGIYAHLPMMYINSLIEIPWFMYRHET